MNKKAFADLKRFGCSTRDAVYAASLTHYFRKVHDLTFPGTKLHIAFSLTSENANWVGYADRRVHPDKDVYVITVRGLFRALTRYQRSWEPAPAPKLLFLVVAIHEVRHRLQFVRPELRLYSTDACPGECRWWDICREVKQRRRRLLSSLRRDGFRDRVRREVANDREEFDASFIEYLAMHDEPRTDDEIRRIVLSEPPPLP